MTIEQIATFSSPVEGKFGLPRQAGLAPSLKGSVRLIGGFARPEALRGLEGFDYIWLLWRFNLNRESRESSLTVRPPRLGGNERVGVFASRSPFRPNGLGLSAVRILGISEGSIAVAGADLMDGTPIYDIKPYIPEADAYPHAKGGFTDSHQWRKLEVVLPESVRTKIPSCHIPSVVETLSLDPRPHYHDNPERIYGMRYADMDIRFQVADGQLTVLDVRKV